MRQTRAKGASVKHDKPGARRAHGARRTLVALPSQAEVARPARSALARWLVRAADAVDDVARRLEHAWPVEWARAWIENFRARGSQVPQLLRQPVGRQLPLCASRKHRIIVPSTVLTPDCDS